MSDGRTASDMPLPGGNFQLFVQKLGVQAMLALGAAENPLTGKREVNLPAARGVIDDLRMLRDKTEGNLLPEEQTHVETVIEELERNLETMEKSVG